MNGNWNAVGESRSPMPFNGALAPYLRAVRTRWLLIALSAFAGLLGGLAIIAFHPPGYEATARLLVSPLPQDDLSSLGLGLIRDSGEPTRTLQTAATLVESPEAAEMTVNRRRGGLTVKEVLESVEVTPEGESDVLAVTARAERPRAAAELANTFAASALALRLRQVQSRLDAAIAQARARQREMGDRSDDTSAALAERLERLEGIRGAQDPTLSLAQLAEIPTAPTGPPPWLLVLLILAGGALIGLIAAVLSESFDRRVRDEIEAVQLIRQPVLARVPQVGRSEVPALTGMPGSVPGAVREAFHSLRIQLDQDPRSPRVVMVTSASSGDGKTLSVVNLASALVSVSRSVIILDLDLRRPAVTGAFGLPAADALVSVLSGRETLADALVSAPENPLVRVLRSEGGGVHLLEPLRRRLPAIVEEARSLADFVLVDTSPVGEVSDALQMTDQVDQILLISRLGHSQRGAVGQAGSLLLGAARAPVGVVLIGRDFDTPNAYTYYASDASAPFNGGATA